MATQMKPQARISEAEPAVQQDELALNASGVADREARRRKRDGMAQAWRG